MKKPVKIPKPITVQLHDLQAGQVLCAVFIGVTFCDLYFYSLWVTELKILQWSSFSSRILIGYCFSDCIGGANETAGLNSSLVLIVAWGREGSNT